jgi:hypothetical protein
MNQILSAFQQETFLEKVLLVLVTAGVTGVLVPLVKWVMDFTKYRSRKRFEADLSRQRELLRAQSQLLDGISEQLWKFRYLAMAVSLYGMDRTNEKSKTKYRKAVQKYDARTWGILNEVRIDVSKSRRLISEDAYRQLRTFYEWLTKELEPRVRKVIGEDTGHGELNGYIYNEASDRIDELLRLLGRELHLASNSAKKWMGFMSWFSVNWSPGYARIEPRA